MEKRDGSNVGGHQHLSPTVTVSYYLPFLNGTLPPEQPQGLGGEAESPP